MTTERDAYTDAVDARILAPFPRLNLPYVKPYEAAASNPTTAPMTFAYLHVDYGDQVWKNIVAGFKMSLDTLYPDCPVVTIGLECEKKGFLLAQAQVFAKMRRSIRGNLVFLDTDIVANRRCDPFGEDFDVGLTDTAENFPMMPFNAGVVLLKDTPGAQEFMDEVMALVNQFPVVDSFWYLNQMALTVAYLKLRDKIKIRIFPHGLYNFAPNGPDEGQDAFFIHCKGPRKLQYDHFLRRLMTREGKPDFDALPGKDITMDEPVADKIGLVAIAPNILENRTRGFAPYNRHRKAPDGSKAAIVGYGPSLLETWEELKDFEGRIFSTSKAHDFLIERGITPDFHVELDYREHKVAFNKLIGKHTRYLLASQVHPRYFDRLPPEAIELFHSDIPGAESTGGTYPRVFPMFDVGLQAAYLAYLANYRDQTWFGIDASTAGTETHAGAHEGIKAPQFRVLVGNRSYGCSSLLIRQALFVERQLCKYPFLKVKITGDGMLRPFLQERGKAKVS
jgi:hypothetical protein